jgi:DNA-binding response OmpR family regulator
MTSSSPARIFWLRRAESIASQKLMGKFTQNGLDISVFNNYDALSTLYDDRVDLCVIETAGQSIKEIKVLVICIRARSRVPLILLSEEISTDWAIQMLVAGVDAVVPTETPDDIVIARTKALLRRWRPQHTE